jgi:hypothetical protein
MDESFQLRARRLLGKREPAQLDFSLLSATLAAQAAASAAGRAQARASASAAPEPTDPLGEIVLGGPARDEAASAQRGCFNRAEVKRRRNEP